MANPILPISPYPDVPIAPGVPNVLRDPANSEPDDGGILTADGPDVSETSTSPQWGLFDQDGNAVITADSVLGFEYKKSWRIPTYPQEQGAFASYNKIEMPGEPRMVFVQAGTVADRTAFLEQIKTVCASLDLYVAYTPEMQWPSVNPIDFNVMNRTADSGAAMIRVELALEEVRFSATQQLTNGAPSPTKTAQPAGQAQQNGGTVQLQPPTPSQSAAATGSLTHQAVGAG